LPLIETEANCECENSHITNLKHANLLPLLRVNLLMFICTSRCVSRWVSHWV